MIPVYNEEKDLQPCVRRLHEHLTRTFPYPFRITIADNASTDTTPQVAARLEAEIAEVAHVRLEQKGRGRALRTVWSASDAPVLAYMDVDLSTDLNALLPLVAPLISGHSDLATGSRLSRSSRVVRGAKREFISRSYNLILRGSLHARFSDAQCGFKAIRKDVARVLLPLVEDTGWFFDTEMLVLAERAGLRIHEVPVDWVDDPDSTVHIVRTATDDLKGVWRVGKALATGALPLDRLARPFGDDPRDREIKDVPTGLARQLVGFCVVGVLSTLFYLLLYSLFRTFCGPQTANALALLVSAVANTAANRRLTFGVRGRGGAVRHQAQGLIVFCIGLAPDQRLARRARRGHRRPRALHRTGGAHRRQPRRDRPALPALPCLGVPGPPGARHHRAAATAVRRRAAALAVRHRPPGRHPVSAAGAPRTTPIRGKRDDRARRPDHRLGPAAPRACRAARGVRVPAGRTAPAVARQARGPPLGAPRTAGAAAGHRAAVPVRPGRLRLRQLLLLGGRTGRAARAGRRSSSARWTRPTRSPSTSPRPRCGRWPCRYGCSA
ncbi:hypothetical protein GCM10020256_39110 [Streptomyces thermocoprophilus]